MEGPSGDGQRVPSGEKERRSMVIALERKMKYDINSGHDNVQRKQLLEKLTQE